MLKQNNKIKHSRLRGFVHQQKPDLCIALGPRVAEAKNNQTKKQKNHMDFETSRVRSGFSLGPRVFEAHAVELARRGGAGTEAVAGLRFMCVYTYIYIYIYVYREREIYIYIYIYIYTYIYIYIYINNNNDKNGNNIIIIINSKSIITRLRERAPAPPESAVLPPEVTNEIGTPNPN